MGKLMEFDFETPIISIHNVEEFVFVLTIDGVVHLYDKTNHECITKFDQ